MAVDERGDQPAVDVAGDGDVKPLRLEDRDRFVSVPVALQLVPVFVEPPAAEAVGQLVGIVVLKCLPLPRMLRSRLRSVPACPPPPSPSGRASGRRSPSGIESPRPGPAG